MLSELSDSELDAVIAEIIAEIEAEEERLAQQSENFGASSPQDQSTNRSQNLGGTMVLLQPNVYQLRSARVP